MKLTVRNESHKLRFDDKTQTIYPVLESFKLKKKKYTTKSKKKKTWDALNFSYYFFFWSHFFFLLLLLIVLHNKYLTIDRPRKNPFIGMKSPPISQAYSYKNVNLSLPPYIILSLPLIYSYSVFISPNIFSYFFYMCSLSLSPQLRARSTSGFVFWFNIDAVRGHWSSSSRRGSAAEATVCCIAGALSHTLSFFLARSLQQSPSRFVYIYIYI